jgi:predicted amidohydrolase
MGTRGVVHSSLSKGPPLRRRPFAFAVAAHICVVRGKRGGVEEFEVTMETFRIALANLRYPPSPEESVALAAQAIADAGKAGAEIVCFPECYIPGYRGLGMCPPPPDAAFLDTAWKRVASAAAQHSVGVILGTERVLNGELRISAMVFNKDGSLAGIQDKVQLDPSEDGFYSAGNCRQIFKAGQLTFGVVICHEGWRYPETVRWAARQGAQIVFHPHFDVADREGYVPTSFADPRNSFHEKAALCRAAENTCYFATVNCAGPRTSTTSAVVNPDGTLLAAQAYGKEGLLIADLDLAQATGLLAKRYKAV